uniref:Large ribosomal subunit protein uL18 n=1 Tax=Magnetococcus massalia (strain MO-1) TaxID=451514 RepID=A0A1S7LKL6_MAGMO|nr:50S ribosomal protein L18 [Candidatus Magnetococcus massalia]
MAMAKDRTQARKARSVRVRQRLKKRQGERPRLSIFRSARHIYAQIIDDVQGRTICSASTVEKDVRDQCANGGNKEAAELIGKRIAEKAKAADISEVVFDRGGFLYHGRSKALADAAREAGLNF